MQESTNPEFNGSKLLLGCAQISAQGGDIWGFAVSQHEVACYYTGLLLCPGLQQSVKNFDPFLHLSVG